MHCATLCAVSSRHQEPHVFHAHASSPTGTVTTPNRVSILSNLSGQQRHAGTLPGGAACTAPTSRPAAPTSRPGPIHLANATACNMHHHSSAVGSPCGTGSFQNHSARQVNHALSYCTAAATTPCLSRWRAACAQWVGPLPWGVEGTTGINNGLRTQRPQHLSAVPCSRHTHANVGTHQCQSAVT